jgi:hypothetical protein
MRTISLLLAAAAILKLLSASSLAQTVLFSDSFSSSSYPKTCVADGATFGPWTVVWAGLGCVATISDSTGTWLNETPGSPTGQARSALTIGPNPTTISPADSYTYNVSLKTVSQLSKNPKNWNVAWFIWNYSNPNSFYTIVLKTAGWELDKEYAVNGTQTACFLATGSKDKFPIGVTYNLQVTDSNAGGVHTISVTVSGGSYGTPKTLATVTDNGACGGPPYPSGNIALYTEAASANFTNVQITTP